MSCRFVVDFNFIFSVGTAMVSTHPVSKLVWKAIVFTTRARPAFSLTTHLYRSRTIGLVAGICTLIITCTRKVWEQDSNRLVNSVCIILLISNLESPLSLDSMSEVLFLFCNIERSGSKRWAAKELEHAHSTSSSRSYKFLWSLLLEDQEKKIAYL